MQPSRLSRRRLLQAAGVAAVASAVLGDNVAGAELPPARPDIGVSAHPFELGQVRLTASRWLDNQNRTLAYLRYVDRYFARYPGVKRYMDERRNQARQDGFVETVYGRRLYLPDIRSRNKQTQQYAERSAINAPMQGTAADIIKLAMIAVDSWCERENAPARLIMQVHDELVLEVRQEAIQEVAAAVQERMASAAELKVPLKIEIGTGANWDEAH
jgi:hypothetical protein